jgi:hypothetical protein
MIAISQYKQLLKHFDMTLKRYAVKLPFDQTLRHKFQNSNGTILIVLQISAFSNSQ